MGKAETWYTSYAVDSILIQKQLISIKYYPGNGASCGDPANDKNTCVP